MILEPPKIKSDTVSTVSPSISHEVMGPDAMIFVFWMLSLRPAFSLSSFTYIKRLFSSSSLSAIRVVVAAAAKLLQLCPTLCDPIDSSPWGSPVPGILQARTLEWVAISFSNAWKWQDYRAVNLSEVPLLVINDADIPISLCQLRQGQDWQVFFLLSSEGQGFRYYSLSRLNLYLNLISQLEWVQSFFPFPQITALYD